MLLSRPAKHKKQCEWAKITLNGCVCSEAVCLESNIWDMVCVRVYIADGRCATDEPTATKTSNINVTAGDYLSTWQAKKLSLCHWITLTQMLTEEQTVWTTDPLRQVSLLFSDSKSRLILCESLRFFLLTTEGPQ